MKTDINYLCKKLHVVVLFSALMLSVSAQDIETGDVDSRPVKNMFESIWLIDNQTVVVPYKGTFEFDIQHRFGIVSNGYEDLFGLYAPANIRLGFGYVPFERLMVGFGITKTNLTWDLNAKYAILQQSRTGGSPLSMSYFVNAAIDTRDKDFFTNPDVVETVDRVSYFHQVMFARKFTERFSLQIAGSLSHFNTVDAFENPQGEIVNRWNNDHLAISVSARYHIVSWVNLIASYDQPLTEHEVLDPQSNVAFGIELTSSSHQFQIFATNFYNITPQRNNVFNNNNFGDGDILLGFNITRLWSF
ncbi:MAG TPA: DUF5777 family beta-barrel protein [Saprospiraceae bacterium]|nr:DUF5777 family beta-barrel protein [Saprospiraceae bacterium]